MKFDRKTIIASVYEIRNKKTNAVYIGSSTHTYFRWDRHVYKLTKGTHANPKLQAAWNKYGADSFEFKILETYDKPTENFLREREKTIILQTGVLITGYNLSSDTVAPMANRKHSDVTRAKMSKSHTGLPNTIEANRKIGEANSRRIWTSQMRKKRAEIARQNQTGKTYTMSSEGRKNITDAAKKRTHSKWNKPMSTQGRENIRQAKLAYWKHIKEAHHTT